MKSVTDKPTTLRRATATGRITASANAIARMESNDLPKKDVLIVARVAGVAAAKNTPGIIPYCHPMPIDGVTIEYEVGTTTVDITATVEAVWKTGVEMEAMAAVSAAALTVYDMLKPVDKDMVIDALQLASKHGGKSQYKDRPSEGFTAAVIVTSDGTSAGKREDRSGVIIRERLEGFGLTPRYEILPDEEDQIEALLRTLVAEKTDLIVTTGGTGLGPRDVTVEATRRVIEREIPGMSEAARMYGQDRTPYAMLSRGIAGVAGSTIIINLPGSSKGTEESLNALFPAVFHAYPMLRGGGH
jgi:cyclic pyranopterin phosphate synthase